MGSGRLVLVCGHVACHKTAMAGAVAPRVRMNIVASYGMGDFDRSSDAVLERDREMRYARLLEITEGYLRLGLPVWLDGNFPWRSLRREVWDLARSYGVGDVVVLQCVCSDPSILEERFARRRADPRHPDAAANDVSAYYRSVEQFEPIEDAELEGIPTWELLLYDSCGETIEPRVPRTPLGAAVLEAMTKLRFVDPAAE